MNPVSPSRDGDQFHYIRGAQLVLGLLQPNSDLIAVTIEGVPSSDDIIAGVEVIDLGLFYGSTEIEAASRIHYRQFKHSTLRSNEPMTSSDLKKTLVGFAKRYSVLATKFEVQDIARRFRFEFETNRPIAKSATAALLELAAGEEGPSSSYLRKELPLSGKPLSDFAKTVHLIPSVPDFLVQRKILTNDTRAYLPDADRDAPLQLLDLVTSKATSQGASERAIKDLDVLHALGVSLDDLYPAEPIFDPVEHLLVRTQVNEIAKDIVEAQHPLIIEADGGVGKSILAQQLGAAMPDGSQSFVFDCFGAGSYRSLSRYRHRARDIAVQIANEMSAAGLCDPLIPTGKADEPAYCRAFLARVEQASTQLSARADALLLIVLDAADNSEAAAREAGQGHSFARMLLREKLPANVRLVLTARPHRVEWLAPPPDARRVVLGAFTEFETSQYLQQRGMVATAAQLREFHRLTSQNPRVQTVALEQAGTMREVLERLGSVPLTVEDTIEALLKSAVIRAKDAGGETEATQIDLICSALAILRPFVPLKIVAETAEVSEALVRSFANDLNGPLLIRENAVQFRDEPTEHWFQQAFRPAGPMLISFIDRLRPLTEHSAYAAAVLPQMMLEAGQLDELVEITLSGKALPKNNEIARRDVEMQRLQFALKAAIRVERYKDAATLAMKAGGNAAVEERQRELISQNTDIAARFLEPNQILEMISRREIGGGDWMGSDHTYRAALLSLHSELGGDASKELRFTLTWLRQWAGMLRAGKDNIGNPTDEDRAAMLFAEININGAHSCAQNLRRWLDRTVSFHSGRLLARRLIDAGRFSDLDDLALAAGNDLGLLLALVLELSLVGRLAPKSAVERAMKLVASKHVTVRQPSDYRGEETLVLTIAQLVMTAAKYNILPRRALAKVLGRYIPKIAPRSLCSRFHFDQHRRFSYLRAYSVRAALRGQTVTQSQIAEPQLRKLLQSKSSQSNGDLDRFKKQSDALLPWHKLWCDFELGRIEPSKLGNLLEQAAATSGKSESPLYGERSGTIDEIAAIWSLMLSGANKVQSWDSLTNWRDQQPYPFPTTVSVGVLQRAAISGDAKAAVNWASYAHSVHSPVREDAESKAEGFLSIARAVLLASEADAKVYFDHAVIAGAEIGQENISRWTSMVELALASRKKDGDDPELAYAFSRAAELTLERAAREKYFDWEGTVRALAAVSPRSLPAILSRWADRRIGEQRRIAPLAFSELVRAGTLSGTSCFALLPFHWSWEFSACLKAALASAGTHADLSVIETLFWRYAKHIRLSSREWTEIGSVLSDAGLIADSAHEQADAMAKREKAEQDKEDILRRKPRQPTESKIELDFGKFDWTSASGIAEAKHHFKDQNDWIEPSTFFNKAIDAIAPGKEPLFLAALGKSGIVRMYDLKSLLDVVPAAWRSRPAVNAALDELILSTFKENCFSVDASNLFQILSLDEAVAGSGVTKRDLASEVVKAIALSSVDPRSAAMFRLTGILSILLSPDESKDALATALQFYEQFHQSDDGDGAWSPDLEPPASVSESLAGYVYAALGSPEPSRRWEAAHCIRSIALLGDQSMISSIISFSKCGQMTAFSSRQLHFYEKHAQQWLIIALARSAMESPGTVGEFATYLWSHANRQNQHVVMRHFAARALLALNHEGALSITVEDISQLLKLDESFLPPINIKERKYAPKHSPVERKYEDRRFHFDYDFSKYNIPQLARAFNMYDTEIELEAERVLVDDWGLQFSGGYEQDERAKRGFFREHGGRSRQNVEADNLNFYLSYHATIVAAGKFLERFPVYQNLEDPSDNYGTYPGWFTEQLLVRSDGYWLFDRRDAWPDFADVDVGIQSDEDWLKAVANCDVRHMVCSSSEQVTVWGYWTDRSGRREQTVIVRSAFISPLNSNAFIRAMSGQGRYAFALPSFDDHDEIHSGSFVLRGWVTDEGRDDGLDASDPWATDLSKRLHVPHNDYRKILGAKSDLLGTTWMSGTEELFRTETWSEPDDSSILKQSGNRLTASRDALQRISNHNKLVLVIEGLVERRINPLEYETFDGTESKGRPFKHELILLENEHG